jgi:hypothetical protein
MASIFSAIIFKNLKRCLGIPGSQTKGPVKTLRTYDAEIYLSIVVF